MSSTSISINGRVTPLDESMLQGARRSRFSFHFSTPRVRRWFLVQMVSVPVDRLQEEARRVRVARAARALVRQPDGLNQVVDHSRSEQMLRRWV